MVILDGCFPRSVPLEVQVGNSLAADPQASGGQRRQQALQGQQGYMAGS